MAKCWRWYIPIIHSDKGSRSYRDADKSLARPGRKQARKHVRGARFQQNRDERRHQVSFLVRLRTHQHPCSMTIAGLHIDLSLKVRLYVYLCLQFCRSRSGVAEDFILLGNNIMTRGKRIPTYRNNAISSSSQRVDVVSKLRNRIARWSSILPKDRFVKKAIPLFDSTCNRIAV